MEMKESDAPATTPLLLVENKGGASFAFNGNSAASRIAGRKLSVLVLALLAELGTIASLNLDVVVERIGIEVVLRNGKPGLAVVVSGTDDHRRPVTTASVRLTPDTSFLDTKTSIVDIILGRGGFAAPDIAVDGIWDGQLLGGACFASQRDDHVLGT